MSLSAYEQKEWDRLQKRKAAALSKNARHLVPAPARDRASAAWGAVQRSPAGEVASTAYASAAAELGRIIGRAASHTVSSDSVLKHFERAGHDVVELGEIHRLDLKVVDSVARLGRVRWGHAGSAALTGLGSAAAITGGTVLVARGSVHDGGAKRAPGFGVVASAYAADVAAVLGLGARTVASTARYYGYDPHAHEEQVFMMSVIGLGMAKGAPAKTAAYAELSQLTQLLFRDATWAKLNEKVLTRVAQQFANRFSVALTKRKFGQFVPVAGMAVGAALNFAVVDSIASAADDAYRERFLSEKSEGTLIAGQVVDSQPTLDQGGLTVIELLEAEDALPELDAGPDPHEPSP